MSKLLLRPLTKEDESSFQSAVSELEKDTPPWQFALDFDHEESFVDYVERVNNWPHGKDLPNGFVPNSYLVGVVESRIVGRLSIRHSLNEHLQKYGGHIGYGIIPSERRKGYANEMLRQALPICRKLGIEKALISCDTNNIASRKVIENNGGIFDSITKFPELDVQQRRYWLYL